MAAEKIPSPEYISLYLKEANDINPGPWYDHSLNVGKAAGIVGEAAGLDPDKAFAFTRDKTAAYLDIKNYFDGKIGHSLYTLLPGIAENTLA